MTRGMIRFHRLAAVAALAAAVLAGTPSANGHPHGWIDLRTEVLVDAEGRVTALRQAWLFDELYSAFILDEFATAGVDREAGLAGLLREDMAALAAYDFFTRVEVAGEPRRVGDARAGANGIAGERIWLRFDLPLARPVAPTAGELRYAVYDPTYFIEMRHAGDEPVDLGGELARSCEAILIPPDPPAEIVGFAAMLDRNANSDDGLGAHFAEWVELRCEP